MCAHSGGCDPPYTTSCPLVRHGFTLFFCQENAERQLAVLQQALEQFAVETEALNSKKETLSYENKALISDKQVLCSEKQALSSAKQALEAEQRKWEKVRREWDAVAVQDFLQRLQQELQEVVVLKAQYENAFDNVGPKDNFPDGAWFEQKRLVHAALQAELLRLQGPARPPGQTLDADPQAPSLGRFRANLMHDTYRARAHQYLQVCVCVCLCVYVCGSPCRGAIM